MSLRILLILTMAISAFGLFQTADEAVPRALFAFGFGLQLFTLIAAMRRPESPEAAAEKALPDQHLTERESESQSLAARAARERDEARAHLRESVETRLSMEIAYKNELSARDEQIAALEAKIAGETLQQDDQAVIQFLRNLQTKGRLIDFVMTDIHRIPDPQVGAVARVVHQGLRDLLQEYFKIAPVVESPEGTVVSFSAEDLESRYRLLQGNSELPGQGKLLHRGWQATNLRLPRSVYKEDERSLRILAPAEVEGRDVHP